MSKMCLLLLLWKKTSEIWPSYKLLGKKKKNLSFHTFSRALAGHSSERFACTKPAPPAAASSRCPGQPRSSPLAWPRLFSPLVEPSTPLQPPPPFLDTVGCCRAGAGRAPSHPPCAAEQGWGHSLPLAQSGNEASPGDGAWRCREDGDVLGRDVPGGPCDGRRLRWLRSLSKAPGRPGEAGKNVSLQFTASCPDFYLIDSYWNTAFSLVQIQEVLGLVCF